MLMYKFIYNFNYSQEVYYHQLQPYSTLSAPKHLMEHSADFLKLVRAVEEKRYNESFY